jgi:hypothetical protein
MHTWLSDSNIFVYTMGILLLVSMYDLQSLLSFSLTLKNVLNFTIFFWSYQIMVTKLILISEVVPLFRSLRVYGVFSARILDKNIP